MISRGETHQRCPPVAYVPQLHYIGNSRIKLILLKAKPTKPILNRFLKFINDLLYAWSRLRLSLQTSPDKGSIQFVFNHGDLPITPFWIWQFPDAHLTEEDTKTVHINLNKIRDENERKYSTALEFLTSNESKCLDPFLSRDKRSHLTI